MTSTISIGHSPDADDAFMFYGIASGLVSTGPYEIDHVIQDIQTLNERSLSGDLEVTAISAAVYPKVANKYRIMSCGASIGRGYGPVVLSLTGQIGESLEGKKIAIPGEQTTAYILLRIFSEGFIPVITDFDAVLPALDKGDVDAALVIHEGQVTWKGLGYVNLMDLGKLWYEETNLPLPLGLDVVRRDLGESANEFIFKMLRDSILTTIEDEEGALDYAMRYGRGIDRELIRTFVRMYVNEDTVQMGTEGKQALEVLYSRAVKHGLLDTVPILDIIGLPE